MGSQRVRHNLSSLAHTHCPQVAKAHPSEGQDFHFFPLPNPPPPPRLVKELSTTEEGKVAKNLLLPPKAPGPGGCLSLPPQPNHAKVQKETEVILFISLSGPNPITKVRCRQHKVLIQTRRPP